MKRLFQRAALAGLILGALPTLANAADTLRAVTAFPTNLAFAQSFLGFVDEVNKRGEGIVQIDYIGGPEAIPQNQQIDALRRGVVDMQYGPSSFYLGRMPEADAWVGATVTPMEARKNGGFEVMQQAFRDKLGVELIGHTDGGPQFHIYLIDEPKRDANGKVDFSNLQIRSQPIYRAFFEELGAIPISVNVPDVYTGLERKTFDGTGWPIIGIKDLNWDRFLRYRIDPGFFSTDLGISVNPKAWQALSPESRALIEEVAVEWEQRSFDNLQAEIEATDKLVREEGMTVITLDDEQAAEFLDAAYDSAWARMKEAGTPHYDALREAYYDR